MSAVVGMRPPAVRIHRRSVSQVRASLQWGSGVRFVDVTGYRTRSRCRPRYTVNWLSSGPNSNRPRHRDCPWSLGGHLRYSSV